MCTSQETPVRAVYSYFLPHTHSPGGAFLEKFSWEAFTYDVRFLGREVGQSASDFQKKSEKISNCPVLGPVPFPIPDFDRLSQSIPSAGKTFSLSLCPRTMKEPLFVCLQKLHCLDPLKTLDSTPYGILGQKKRHPEII